MRPPRLRRVWWGGPVVRVAPPAVTPPHPPTPVLGTANPETAVAGEPVNGYDILDKVASLPISTWRYKWEPGHVRHLGPMAQDWYATFGLADTDTAIPCVDANGVAMVAIQALYRRITDLENELTELTGRSQAPTQAQPLRRASASVAAPQAPGPDTVRDPAAGHPRPHRHRGTGSAGSRGVGHARRDLLSEASTTTPRRIFQFAHRLDAIPPLCRDCMASVQDFAAAHGYTYRLLTLDDLPALIHDATRPPALADGTDQFLPDLLRRCRNLGDLSDLVRSILLDQHGGWWFDWDLRVVHPDRLADHLQAAARFHWSGIVSEDDDIVSSEFQGAAPANPIHRGFLDWLASTTHHRDPGQFLAGPHEFTAYLRTIGFIDHRLHLDPLGHTFQAGYTQVKRFAAFPDPADPRPLFHHWVHAWAKPFDLSAWINDHFPPAEREDHQPRP
ncbi:tail fiber domain-containing protein [Actinoallomurus sp. NPDC052274]|uniref:tail fiber domain-containing protein n=1 Tax=Actinoallomurus sp. NPDC052274 TaxID=3155420 RepID=UPI00342D3F07